MGLTDFNSSALVEHMWMSDHSINWASAKVLVNPCDYKTRSIREAFSVRMSHGTVNQDGGTLPTGYENLVSNTGNFW